MYLALARKYRPQKFSELIGQPHITRTLQNSIKMDKIYQSLIFSGMKGVGKTSTARIFAKALNCEHGPAEEPCNKCEICKEITEDRSPDYIEIDGASNNGVEEIRKLKEKVNYRPQKNRFRVVVIDEVHMLSNNAWNALLKIIEEPPEHTIFIMATTDFHKIPATIVSRCQHFEFRAIPYEVITDVLKNISKKEGISISDYSLFLISKAAEGSLRDAKKLLDQAIAISGGNIKDKEVIEILGIIEEDIFISLTKSFLNNNKETILKEIENLIQKGVDLRYFYIEYLKFFRDLLILKSLDNVDYLYSLNPENIDNLKEMLKDISEIDLIRYFNALKDMEIMIKHTDNPRIILEFMFIKLTLFNKLESIEEIINQIKKGKTIITRQDNKNFNIPQNQTPKHSKITKNKELLNNSNELVNELCNRLDSLSPRLSSVIRMAANKIEDNKLILEFKSTMKVSYEMVKNNKALIIKNIQELTGESIELICILKKDDFNENEAIKKIEKDDKIKKLKNELNMKIRDIKLKK